MRYIWKSIKLIGLTLLTGIVLLVITILNPTMLYANTTVMESNVVIHHSEPLTKSFELNLDKALSLVRQSELYDADFNIQIALNDGSHYPSIMQKIQGPAFGYGYANIVVLSASIDPDNDKAYWNGKAWHLPELIAHEMVHTYQYNSFGFKTTTTETWKTEGYAEFVSRASRQRSITDDWEWLQSFNDLNPNNHWGWLEYADGTGVPSIYLEYGLLVRYMMEIEGLTYQELVADKSSQEEVYNRLSNWVDSAN